MVKINHIHSQLCQMGKIPTTNMFWRSTGNLEWDVRKKIRKIARVDTLLLAVGFTPVLCVCCDCRNTCSTFGLDKHSHGMSRNTTRSWSHELVIGSWKSSALVRWKVTRWYVVMWPWCLTPQWDTPLMLCGFHKQIACTEKSANIVTDVA